MSARPTMRPSVSTNAIDSGSGVSRIQKQCRAAD
jgi:hypothetical protein